jgi:hypothetical protein
MYDTPNEYAFDHKPSNVLQTATPENCDRLRALHSSKRTYGKGGAELYQGDWVSDESVAILGYTGLVLKGHLRFKQKKVSLIGSTDGGCPLAAFLSFICWEHTTDVEELQSNLNAIISKLSGRAACPKTCPRCSGEGCKFL